jgi:hypothetical protein
VAGNEKWFDRQLSIEEFRNFVAEARAGKSNTKVYIGDVQPEASQRISAVSGKSVSHIMLESEAVRHSYGKAHHLLENDDIFLYVDVVNTATDIKISGKKHQNNEVITFTKDIEGRYFCGRGTG